MTLVELEACKKALSAAVVHMCFSGGLLCRTPDEYLERLCAAWKNRYEENMEALSPERPEWDGTKVPHG